MKGIETNKTAQPFKGAAVVVERHDQWSIYQERSAQLRDGFVRWIEDTDMAYIIDLQAGPSSRGREMLEWLKSATGKSLFAVGVVDDAAEFWDKMEDVALIDGQSAEGFMSFFGRGLGGSRRMEAEDRRPAVPPSSSSGAISAKAPTVNAQAKRPGPLIR